jgi:hypothetical protein
MNAPDAYTRFLALVRAMGAARRVDCDYRLYDSLKREAWDQFPGLHPQEYERLVAEISKACGV